MDVQPPDCHLLLRQVELPIASISSAHCTKRIAQTNHQDQAIGGALPPPWLRSRSRKALVSRPCPERWSHTKNRRFSGVDRCFAHAAGDPLFRTSVMVTQHPIHSRLAAAPLVSFRGLRVTILDQAEQGVTSSVFAPSVCGNGLYRIRRYACHGGAGTFSFPSQTARYGHRQEVDQ